MVRARPTAAAGGTGASISDPWLFVLMGTVELQQDNAWSIVRAPTLLQVTDPLQIIAQVPLASHVDIVARWADAAPLAGLLARAITENLATLLDCYLQADAPPTPAELRAWRDTLPYQPGYLDRVAVYCQATPQSAYARVSPRLWLILPWTAQANPVDYADIAKIIWEVELAAGETPPLGAWRAAGGAGVWTRDRAAPLATQRQRPGKRRPAGVCG